MRRPVLLAVLAAVAATTALPLTADAQSRRSEEQRRPSEEDKRADKKKRDAEWNLNPGRLDGKANVGPCPYVKVLYDAHRYVEFEGGREASAAVGYTGEIQGISAGCSYQENDPISVNMAVGFAFGKGPQAEGQEKTYRYWVAVTQRNSGVIAKEYFTVPVRFAPGQDRIIRTERLEGIVIPRAEATTSGSNFEVLVGFDVTPEMAAFNRDGKRFRINAAPVQAAAATPPSTAQ